MTSKPRVVIHRDQWGVETIICDAEGIELLQINESVARECIARRMIRQVHPSLIDALVAGHTRPAVVRHLRVVR